MNTLFETLKRALGGNQATTFINSLENSMKAGYRKYNDGSMNSSTYHKKDGTNVRAILKVQLVKELKCINTKPYAIKEE